MKKIKVTLAYDPAPAFGRKAYQVIKLTNCTEVNGYRVTCQLDSVEANKIALNRKYDVTIVPA